MFKIMPPLTVEFRDNWIAFCQGDRIVVLPAQMVDESNMLPDPDSVRRALHNADIKATSAVVILPRNKALIGMGNRPIKKRRELLACAYLEAKSAASALNGQTYIATTARSYTNAGWIAWCVYPKQLIDEVDTWLKEINITIREVRVSTFENTKLRLPKAPSGEAHAVLSVYPSGSWDLVWLSGREYGLPYSSSSFLTYNRPDTEELARALTILVIRSLAETDVFSQVDIDTNITLRSHQLKLNLHLAASPEVRPLVEQATNSAVALLATDDICLNILLSELLLVSQWPTIALKANRSLFSPHTPVIRPAKDNNERRLNVKCKAVIAIATIVLTLITFTLGLDLYEKRIAHDLNELQLSAMQVQTNSRALAEIRQLVSNQLLPVLVLHELDKIFEADAVIHTLEITGTELRATVYTTSTSAAYIMQKLVAANQFYDVSMVGNISMQIDDGKPKEIMSFTATYMR